MDEQLRIAVLARLDAMAAELAATRALVVDGLPAVPVNDPADDVREAGEVALALGFPKDTIRKWARQERLGEKRGGRWYVSLSRCRARAALV